MRGGKCGGGSALPTVPSRPPRRILWSRTLCSPVLLLPSSLFSGCPCPTGLGSRSAAAVAVGSKKIALLASSRRGSRPAHRKLQLWASSPPQQLSSSSQLKQPATNRTRQQQNEQPSLGQPSNAQQGPAQPSQQLANPANPRPRKRLLLLLGALSRVESAQACAIRAMFHVPQVVPLVPDRAPLDALLSYHL